MNGLDNPTLYANVSEESKVSTETAPNPLSTFRLFKLTKLFVICFLVSITVTLTESKLMLTKVCTACCSEGIVISPSESIFISPNSWKPAG